MHARRPHARRLRMRAKLGFITAAAAICCLLSCRSGGSPIEDPAVAASRFIGAFNNLDIDELRGLFSEDATAFLPFAATGARLNGRDAIIQAIAPMFEKERARSPQGPPYLHLTARDLTVQRIGRDAAVVSFDVGNQQVFSRRTLVLELVSGRWLAVHLHASNIRPESGAL